MWAMQRGLLASVVQVALVLQTGVLYVAGKEENNQLAS